MLHLTAVPEPVAALLARLSSSNALKHFALGGGTSLALRFGHRLSVDLDYFTTDEFAPDTLAELLHHHTLDEMLRFFTQKYPTTDPFAVIRSLAWFDDAEIEPDPVPLAGQVWEIIKRRVIAAVRDL